MKQFRDTDYYVTEDGKVISTKFGKTRELKLSYDNHGYLKVNISNKGKTQTFKLHRLVAECYIPNPNNLPEVDHLDTNKLNNHISNLEWVTGEENNNRAKKNGLHIKGVNHYKSKFSEDDIKWIRINSKNHSIKYLCNKFNVSLNTITFILNHKTWKHL